MKKSKKALSIILAVILTVSVITTAFIVSATAKKTAISITVNKTELAAGESATVSVKVTANYSIATMSIPVFYDKTLVSVSDATATLTDYDVSSTTTDEQSVDSDKIYANTGVSSAKFGFVLVNYIGGAGKDVPEAMDSVVLTFKITAKEDVNGSDVIKCVSRSAKTDNNIAGMLYFGSPASGRKIDSIPENIENIDVTNASATVNISDGTNTLKLEDAYADSGIIVDLEIAGLMASEDWYSHLIDAEDANVTGVIYGLDTIGYDDAFASETYATLDDALTTSNGDDYLEIIAPEVAEGYETTGTIINVLDDEGNVLEKYVFVYFGDVNGDAYIDANDAAEVKAFDFYQDSITTVAGVMAADYNGDSYMDTNDGADITYVDFYQEGYPLQADLATAFYAAAYGL